MVNLRRADIFVAMITNEVINNKDIIKQFELISSLGTKMYAVVEEGLSFDKISHIPWRMMFRFSHLNEINGIMNYIGIESRGGFHT